MKDIIVKLIHIKGGEKIDMSIDSIKEHNFETEQKLNNYNRINIQESNNINQEEENKIITNINIIKNIEDEKSKENSLPFKNNTFKKQKSIKSEMIYLLNIITEVNFSNILDKLTQIILEKENNDDILNKEYIFLFLLLTIFSLFKFKIFSVLIT